jgi:hypothetical protein
MSGLLPINTTLQLGDNSGNINHQGILSSNLTGTTALSPTFPTTPTGDSLGHYHYTESGSGALKFLNACGTGTGGHQFFTSNSTTAPFKTGTIDSNGFTILKNNDTSNLDENSLSITNGTTSSYLSLINDPSNSSLSLTNVGISGVYGAGGTTITNITNSSESIFQSFQATIIQNTDTLTLNSAYIRFSKTGDNSAIFLSNDDNSPIIRTTDSTSNESILSATTLNITSGVDVSILSSTSLTFNGTNVKMNQVTPTLIYSSAVIYADGQPPATSLLIRNTYGYSGWYFKNIVVGQKINWYFPPKNATNTLVSSLKGISISFFNGVTVSSDNTLFITIYTRPTGSGDYAPGFFHSSNTYIFNQSITPVANTNYQGVCIIDMSLVPFNFETQIQYQQSTVNNPRGTFSQTDNILAVTIGSNSASAVNTVEFVVNKLNLHYDDFTQSYLLVSP